jgi:hypothetical protein
MVPPSSHCCGMTVSRCGSRWTTACTSSEPSCRPGPPPCLSWSTRGMAMMRVMVTVMVTRLQSSRRKRAAGVRRKTHADVCRKPKYQEHMASTQNSDTRCYRIVTVMLPK